MRPTAKDLAKAAGVSLATVDRVLNGRPNVSRKAAAKVHEAIERTGFVRNISAVNLARNTTYRFRFVLPEAGDQFLKEIMKEVGAANSALRSEMVSADVAQIAIEDPHVVANYLSSLDESKLDGVALFAPESPQVRDAIGRLVERDIKVVRLLAGKEQADGVDFVGINNYAAGATAGRIVGRFVHHAQGSVMVISETMRAQDSIERRLGFDAVINESFPHLRVLPSLETHADIQRTRQVVSSTLKYNADIVALYVMSSEARPPLACVSELIDLRDLVVVAHEHTPYCIDALRTGEIDAVIAQNPGHAVRSAIRLMRARADNRLAAIESERLRIEILLKDNL
ncbi:MAG: LacI family DNA-binding transcriptional regulator [Alphaproteobacteria bacterium]|nr:LacI family DNA-binding transcriptional regulator [Alphaproteobacteria bacterium]